MADEILAAGGVGLVAVLALLVATVRDVDGRTGGSDWTDNLPDSDDGTAFQFEDPEDRWSEGDFDFGGPGGSTSDGTGSSDPSGMTDPATQPWRS